jgi:hypothetical protein
MNSFAIRGSLTGTDAEVVDQLRATGVTAKPISLDELLYTLNMRGMLVKLALPGDGGEKWTGSIMALIGAINQIGTDSQKLAVSIWFSHITNSRNTQWDTTKPEHAAPFWQLFLAFADQPGMPTVADFEAIAAIGGGWLFANLTVEQYQADKLAHEQSQADALAQQQEQEAVRINQARKVQMYSALLDAANWLSIQEQCPTQAELLAYLTPNLPTEE